MSDSTDMYAHPPPPFDATLWLRAWHETWLATLWPGIAKSQRACRLAALIDAALRDSPLYRQRARGTRVLEDFAPIGKAELMQHFDDWATDRRITRAAAQEFLARHDCVGDGWLDGDYLLWTSSGTSGVPGWFVQDAQSLAAYDVIDALRLRGASPTQPSLGMWSLGQRFAFVGASGGHFAGVTSLTRLARIVPPAWRPPITLLSVQQPLVQVARELEAARPTVLITYPSAADALAGMLREGTLTLALRELWLGGEQLSAAQRARVGAAFGCPVRNNYGASECFSIAWECVHGTLHLNDDWVIAEPVDAQGRPVAPGELSHAVWLTNLANRTQPLIRYRLEDRMRLLPGRCACGSAFTAVEVSGRSGDVLRLPDAHHRPVTVLPLALATAIEEDAGVTRFQVIHRQKQDAHTLEVRFEDVVRDRRAAFRRCRTAIDRYLATQRVAYTHCTFSNAAPRRDLPSGKLRRVVTEAAKQAVGR